MTEATAYATALPEIIVALGAMAMLMLGAFSADDEKAGATANWLSLLILAGAAVALVGLPVDRPALFEGAFIADGFARFVKLLVLAGSAGAILLSLDYFRQAKLLKYEIPVLILLATVGMMMMVSAGDLIALYLGLELQSLSLYVLAAIRRDQVRSSEAGLKYFVLGALSSGMLLYGASLIYGFSGTTTFSGIAAAAAKGAGPDSIGLMIGLVFLLVGLAFKVSAVPFHMWVPDVYEGSPTPVTAFFAAAPKIAAFALLTRVLTSGFPGLEAQWQQIVVVLAVASMLVGALGAIGQTNIKRLMAYSSIGHVGFALVGLAAGSREGVESVLVYLAIYLVMTLGTFACILAMRKKDEVVEDIASLAGLAENNLALAAVFAVLLFSLAGVPPLAGFVAKLWVFSAAVKAGLYPLAIIGVLTSVVALFYYLRIVKVMFFDEPKEKFRPADFYQRAVMIGAGLFVVGYLLMPSPLVEAAASAAGALQR
ncbi:MAG: NADH-quinone oxidoreductase subunit NuoN [Hyphomicrobium sp.]